MAQVFTDPNGTSYIYVDGEWHAAPVVAGAGANGGQDAVNAVAGDGGSDAGSDQGDSASGLGGKWPDLGALLQTSKFPWVLLAAGVILIVLASGHRRRR